MDVNGEETLTFFGSCPGRRRCSLLQVPSTSKSAAFSRRKSGLRPTGQQNARRRRRHFVRPKKSSGLRLRSLLEARRLTSLASLRTAGGGASSIDLFRPASQRSLGQAT
jgi:hypothetical protein